MDKKEDPNQSNKDQIYKVVLIGDAGVGKTHLMSRYVKGVLPKNTVPTIGIEFAGKQVQLKNQKVVKAQIWDTAGQERYRGITTNHLRKAIGALVVYDITKESSFESVSKWIEDLKYHAEPNVVIIIVGNKSDLADANPAVRKVQKEEGRNLAKQYNAMFEEASAINGNNVTSCFETLMNEIQNAQTLQNPAQQTGQEGVRLTKTDSISNSPPQNNCGC